MGNGVDCICMAQDRMQWLFRLNVAMNLMFHNCWGSFLNQFAKRILLYLFRLLM